MERSETNKIGGQNPQTRFTGETFLEVVDPAQILSRVTETVALSGKEILTTILLADELATRLPFSYHQLLKAKANDGVQITRIGFGSEEDALKFDYIYTLGSSNYFFVSNPNVGQYQRMIIIDRKNLFFRVGDTFVHSNHRPLVEAFRERFFTLQSNARN